MCKQTAEPRLCAVERKVTPLGIITGASRARAQGCYPETKLRVVLCVGISVGINVQMTHQQHLTSMSGSMWLALQM